MRINKYLAHAGYCSRKEADEMIERGEVKINNRIAKIGDLVLPDDKVEVSKNAKKKELAYLAFNKPKGVITHSPQGKEKSIGDILKFSKEVFPIGRLDKDSEGLIILTNDGRVTDRLLNPDHDHEKEYAVTVDREVSPAFVAKMRAGVILDDGYKTKKCVVKKAGSFSFDIVLTEGKKHQIRRMCEQSGCRVKNLKRIRVMNILLGNLKAGQYREIGGKELEGFLGLLKLGKSLPTSLCKREEFSPLEKEGQG